MSEGNYLLFKECEYIIERGKNVEKEKDISFEKRDEKDMGPVLVPDSQ